jgi:5-(carboxyamino)imidazole ribonucleotide synthase
MRSILNLPLGDTRTIQPGVMINVLGEKDYVGKATYDGLEKVMEISGVKAHIYGKEETKPFRKMGHITIVAPSIEEAKATGRKVKEMIRVIS